MPDLSTPQGQAMVESGLAGGDLLAITSARRESLTLSAEILQEYSFA